MHADFGSCYFINRVILFCLALLANVCDWWLGESLVAWWHCWWRCEEHVIVFDRVWSWCFVCCGSSCVAILVKVWFMYMRVANLWFEQILTVVKILTCMCALNKFLSVHRTNHKIILQNIYNYKMYIYFIKKRFSQTFSSKRLQTLSTWEHKFLSKKEFPFCYNISLFSKGFSTITCVSDHHIAT